MPGWKTILRTNADGTETRGTFVHAFHNNGGTYHLTTVDIYADGRIDCISRGDFKSFRAEVERGQIRTMLPEGADVVLYPLAQFTATNVNTEPGEARWIGVDPAEFLKEVADEIERLNNRPTTLDRCRAAYLAWKQAKTPTALESLRTAYEAVPAYNRVFVLGDQDRSDLPIRAALFGGRDAEIYAEFFHNRDGFDE
ncbi:MAG: hypothetical protein V4671_16385 [Armatimonadota bacterium]